MSVEPLTEDQSDALQELANVAMGRAGKSLSTLLDSFVVLSVPRVTVVDVEDVAAQVAQMPGAPEIGTAIRQAFFPAVRGEAITLFGPEGCREIADLMGHEGELADAQEQELLLDTANILVGAVLNGLGEQMETEFKYTPPSILAVRTPLPKLLNAENLEWNCALLIEVNFSLDERGFKCHMLTLMPENSLDYIRSTLDQMLEDL
jgi:chemotaxis protein CheC